MALVITFIGSRKAQRPEKSRCQSPSNHAPRCNCSLTSLRWINLFYTIKMDKKSIVNDLYQAIFISVLAVGYSMLGKKILCIAPLHFYLEDMEKLVTIIAASEMTREYLIRQKILPDHIIV